MISFSNVVQLVLEPLAVGSLKKCAAASRESCRTAAFALRRKARWDHADYHDLQWEDLQVLLLVPQHLNALHLEFPRFVPENIRPTPQRLQEARQLIRQIVNRGSTSLTHVEVSGNCFRKDQLEDDVVMLELVPVACRLVILYTEAQYGGSALSALLLAAHCLEVLAAPNITLESLVEFISDAEPAKPKLGALKVLRVKGPSGKFLANMRLQYGVENPFEILRTSWPSLQRVEEWAPQTARHSQPSPDADCLADLLSALNLSVSDIQVFAARLGLTFASRPHEIELQSRTHEIEEDKYHNEGEDKSEAFLEE